MTSVTQKNGDFSVTAHGGDCKTLLAWNLPKATTKKLAGFTIQYDTADGQSFFIFNNLQFKQPALHAQDPTKPATSSINAPIHKFRWVHVPGSLNQGTEPFFGIYTYTVTPRYFDSNEHLLPIDRSLSASVPIQVGPFVKGKVALGFARGYVQSQAFVHQFGPDAKFRPDGKELLFNTALVAGTSPRTGKPFTFAQEYGWMGFTARTKIFEILDEVSKNKALKLSVFAYDLNEPDVMKALLTLAAEKRVRIILDNATLHHTADSKTTPEDQFENKFNAAAKAPAEIIRGKFGRFAHDKVFIVSEGATAKKVLTGSSNLSVTGLYVNSNHILVFDDPNVAGVYAQVFEASWTGKVSESFNKDPLAAQTKSFNGNGVPNTDITFSPHQAPFATQILTDLANRIDTEGQQKNGSVLFAVMDTGVGTGPVLPALVDIHKNTNIFSYGISDSTAGIFLYSPRKKTGVKVTGKPGATVLPPPFDQVRTVGIGHQIHHKFVVCGFNGPNPVVYCGSSNLALGGEESNGDNLLAIYDRDIATVFVIEALTLVDHFDFLDRFMQKSKQAKLPTGSKQQAAALAGWFLSTTDTWAQPYFDPNDLHFVDRNLFAE